MPTIWTRFLDDVVAQLGTLAPPAGLVGLEYREPRELNPTDFPALFVELGSEGSDEHHPHGHIKEERGFFVWGWVSTAITGSGGRQKEREEFYGLVMNHLEKTGAASLQERLQTSLAANSGRGVTLVRRDGPPLVDVGQPPGTSPYTGFLQGFRAVAHFDRGAM